MNTFKEAVRRLVLFVLTLEAKAILKKYHPKLVLVTGSVGKTSTKDAVYTALADSFFVRRSEKSYNSDIGVPLTVLGVPNGWNNPFQWVKNILEGGFLILMQAPYPEWLVLEVGADRPGDITKSLAWLAPDIVVGTLFPKIPVHVEFYASPEEVVKEELAPATWLAEGGTFIVNADDVRATNAKTREGVRKITYGFGEYAMLRANRYHVHSQGKAASGISFDVEYAGERTHVSLKGVVGEQHVYPILAGLATGIALGVPLTKTEETFSSHEPPAGRMRLIAGMRGSTIIDDSYNASPAATEEALAALSEIPRKGKRIAVLADMLELGSFSVKEHYRIGSLVPSAADILITVGIRARDIAKGARDSGMNAEQVFECERGVDAASRLVSLIEPGDAVLIKGSQSMRMERVVKSVMAEPEKAKQLLVRQDAEWSVR